MNLLQRAKALRAKQPLKFKKWQDAVKAASLINTPNKATKIVSDRINKMNLNASQMASVGGVKKKKQTGTSNRKIDKRIQALPVGKRKAGAGAKRPVYYESRANRSDKGVLLGVGAINKDLKTKYSAVLDIIADTKGEIARQTERYKQSKPKNKIIAARLKKLKKDLQELQKTKLKLSKFK